MIYLKEFECYKCLTVFYMEKKEGTPKYCPYCQTQAVHYTDRVVKVGNE